jgi:hypothetical protein
MITNLTFAHVFAKAKSYGLNLILFLEQNELFYLIFFFELLDDLYNLQFFLKEPHLNFEATDF